MRIASLQQFFLPFVLPRDNFADSSGADHPVHFAVADPLHPIGLPGQQHDVFEMDGTLQAIKIVEIVLIPIRVNEFECIFLRPDAGLLEQFPGDGAIARELFEETGIRAEEDAFELIDTDRDKNNFYDFYCLKCPIHLKDIVLLPGETDGVQWVSYGKMNWMIRTGRICKIIARQYKRQEKLLKARNPHKTEA